MSAAGFFLFQSLLYPLFSSLIWRINLTIKTNKKGERNVLRGVFYMFEATVEMSATSMR